MKTRIKKIEYSDGRVEYIPQIKKFGYSIYSNKDIRLFGWWWLMGLFPLANILCFIYLIHIVLDSLFWQDCDDERYYEVTEFTEETARERLDNVLEKYRIKMSGEDKITKKVQYIKHP